MANSRNSSNLRPESEIGADDRGRTLETDFADAPGLTSGERTLARRLTGVLRFTDLMTALMVAATAFSAFATWQTAKVTSLLFSVAERPYIGVLDIHFETAGHWSNSALSGGDVLRKDGDAHLVVDCRNFGHVQATDGVARVRVLIDGHALSHQAGSFAINNIGMVSPSAPHLIYRFIPAAIYRAVSAGHARMVVQVMFNYRGPSEREFCYNETMTYEPHANQFIASGGSDHCADAVY